MNNIFTKEDYNSPDGILTSIWGPLVWHFLHIISFNYPVKPTKQEKKHYKDYLLSLGNVLPCKYCRINFKRNLEMCGFSDSVFKNRDSFSKFIYKFHNCVNKMLSKPKFQNYSFIRDRYEVFRARCINDTPLIPKNSEKGCLTPLYGLQSKSIISIVPKSSRKEGFRMDPRCKIKKRQSKSRRKSKSKK